MSGQIYPHCCHADDWSGNLWTLQRKFVQGGYEQKIHAIIPASQGVCVEDVVAIGKGNRAVGL